MISERAARQVAALAPELDAGVLESVASQDLLDEVPLLPPPDEQADRDVLGNALHPKSENCRATDALEPRDLSDRRAAGA